MLRFTSNVSFVPTANIGRLRRPPYFSATTIRHFPSVVGEVLPQLGAQKIPSPPLFCRAFAAAF